MFASLCRSVKFFRCFPRVTWQNPFSRVWQLSFSHLFLICIIVRYLEFDSCKTNLVQAGTQTLLFLTVEASIIVLKSNLKHLFLNCHFVSSLRWALRMQVPVDLLNFQGHFVADFAVQAASFTIKRWFESCSRGWGSQQVEPRSAPLRA